MFKSYDQMFNMVMSYNMLLPSASLKLTFPWIPLKTGLVMRHMYISDELDKVW